ncbi:MULTISPECIES: zinc-ribbon domain-containing protein [unclassified Microbacterium]|uniref:zinc-ribbon domain-containing protein n=1 Tax=unclassified Microbacterium TaxID=2609290 RepID=UPI003018418B
MIERPIDFTRPRRMKCGACAHEWDATIDWLDRFDQGKEGCPACGTDCRGEDRPDFTATPEDLAHDEAATCDLTWYHSSTHAVWPDRDFDAASGLTEETRQRMESMSARPGAVERWAARQKSKALHVGTYEAAVENMFRRIDDEGGSTDQFFLHRVRLRQDCVIEPGVHPEPTDFVGNAYLAEVCAPGVNVLRYVNVHEDASRISLALDIDAIDAVQSIPIPLPIDTGDAWITDATARLRSASLRPPEPMTSKLQRFRPRPIPALVAEGRQLVEEAGAELPVNLRDRFDLETDEETFASDPAGFPARILGLVRLVTDPRQVLAALDAQDWRTV